MVEFGDSRLGEPHRIGGNAGMVLGFGCGFGEALGFIGEEPLAFEAAGGDAEEGVEQCGGG